MSETETILLVVLGFSLASLIALFMGRMLWTAAVRAGARRMQRQVPSSVIALQTERDRLRAEYAMLAQRLGSKLEDARLRLAEQTAEVNRHRNRIHDIESSADARATELRQAKARVTELEQALAAATAAARPQPKTPKRSKKRSPARPPEDAELRLRQRIDKLSELARARPPADTAEIIAQRLAEAERQTRDLEADLRKLDTEPDNIIQLPNRGRDLKTGSSSP